MEARVIPKFIFNGFEWKNSTVNTRKVIESNLCEVSCYQIRPDFFLFDVFIHIAFQKLFIDNKRLNDPFVYLSKGP